MPRTHAPPSTALRAPAVPTRAFAAPRRYMICTVYSVLYSKEGCHYCAQYEEECARLNEVVHAYVSTVEVLLRPCTYRRLLIVSVCVHAEWKLLQLAPRRSNQLDARLHDRFVVPVCHSVRFPVGRGQRDGQDAHGARRLGCHPSLVDEWRVPGDAVQAM